MTTQPLAGKQTLVTGASRGIGKGIALAYAEAGADVALAARTVSDLESVAEDIRALGRRALVIEMDAYELTQVEAAVDETVASFGRIDVLVNNAGGSRNVEGGWMGLLDTEPKTVDLVFKLHVTSPYTAARRAAQAMIKQGDGGVILNITSGLAFYPSIRVQNYSASKVALQELTKLWGVELGPYKIRVNAIGPGITRSATTDKLFTTPEAEQAAAERIPLGRIGEPSDIAAAAIYLASDAAEWVSGGTLLIGGGQRH